MVIPSSDVGGNRGSGLAMKVGDPSVAFQELLGSLGVPRTELTPLLSSCGPMRLQGQILATGGRDNRLVFDRVKGWDGSDGGTITGQPVGADRCWNVDFAEQPNQERSCSSSLSVALSQDIEHDYVFVSSPPQPVPDTSDGCTTPRRCVTGSPGGAPVNTARQR